MSMIQRCILLFSCVFIILITSDVCVIVHLLFCHIGKKYYFCTRFRKDARVVEEARLESE